MKAKCEAGIWSTRPRISKINEVDGNGQRTIRLFRPLDKTMPLEDNDDKYDDHPTWQRSKTKQELVLLH
ncbi:hypothetical protein M8J77_019436 [Diaphorina citri]|nr:hypothetical protein M8J77_019436 [Diaphorina citri]